MVPTFGLPTGHVAFSTSSFKRCGLEIADECSNHRRSVPSSGNRNNQTQPDQTVKLSNGATATSYHNCGDMDLCARISNTDGSVLSIYSEGAALCQPYYLHFVLQNASGVTHSNSLAW